MTRHAYPTPKFTLAAFIATRSICMIGCVLIAAMLRKNRPIGWSCLTETEVPGKVV